MNVTGSPQAPCIGVVKADKTATDLVHCPLTPPHIQRLLEDLRRYITELSLVPYDIIERRGELKNLIVMSNQQATEGILRFVLRSTEAIPRIKKRIHDIQAVHPWVTVITCNIQPLPAAILEGPEEVVLTERSLIEEQYGSLTLSFAPQSFMQVTPEIAGALYQRAASYVKEQSYTSALDLFCGVGGFSLSIAPFVSHVIGVEISPQAIQSAALSAQKLGFSHVQFYADDTERFLSHELKQKPDLIVTNPPRRGLSESIISLLMSLDPRTILYSSCSPETFARDCELLSSMYSLERISLFDMFAMTEHCEVLGVLNRIK
jgi:23S rRNA (uracil747-C5)-methyltransferase